MITYLFEKNSSPNLHMSNISVLQEPQLSRVDSLSYNFVTKFFVWGFAKYQQNLLCPFWQNFVFSWNYVLFNFVKYFLQYVSNLVVKFYVI